MRTRNEKNNGNTLVETLVVISILGIFMGIALPGVSKSFRVISQVKQMTARYPNARLALGRMSEMIRHTYPAALDSGSSFVGKSSAIEAGAIMLPSDEITFPILDTSYGHLRSAQEITYRVDLIPEKGETLRGLVEKRSFAGALAGAGAEETIKGRIVGLNFRYLSDAAGSENWEEQWPPSSSDEAGGVPAAVEITIFVLGDISPEPKSFTTVVNIPSQ